METRRLKDKASSFHLRKVKETQEIVNQQPLHHPLNKSDRARNSRDNRQVINPNNNSKGSKEALEWGGSKILILS
jgi:hypothetical protein